MGCMAVRLRWEINSCIMPFSIIIMDQWSNTRLRVCVAELRYEQLYNYFGVDNE